MKHLLLSKLKTVLLLNMETVKIIIFSLCQKSKFLCNIINVFTVTFDQLYASLLNNYIHFKKGLTNQTFEWWCMVIWMKKKLTLVGPKFLKVSV